MRKAAEYNISTGGEFTWYDETGEALAMTYTQHVLVRTELHVLRGAAEAVGDVRTADHLPPWVLVNLANTNMFCF